MQISFFYYFRNVLVAVSEDYVYSTHTGWLKIRHINISKWFWLIHHTMPFVAIPRSTGSARLSWSIVKCAVLHQLERVHVVLAKDTDFHKQLVDLDVLPGNARIVCICDESDRVFSFTEYRRIYFHFMYATTSVYLVEINFSLRI